jgi:hypothetical protein
MPVTDDLQAIGERADRELDALHDFFEHSKIVWRSFQILMEEEHKISAENLVTGTRATTFGVSESRSNRSGVRDRNSSARKPVPSVRAYRIDRSSPLIPITTGPFSVVLTSSRFWSSPCIYYPCGPLRP